MPEFAEVTGKDRVVRQAANGGRFPLTGRGDVNTYALFAELFARLTGPAGRAGVIVPTGIATDATTAPFFAHLVGKRRLASLVDFENSAPTFPAVHRSFKFCLLTLGRDEPEARFAFFLTSPGQLAEPERNFTLSPAEIAAINPNTRTAPVFRSRADAELTARIYRNAPVLIEEGRGPEGNPWGVRLRTMLHKTNASQAGHLKSVGEVEPSTIGVHWIPVFEGDYGFQFDHRYGTGVSGDFRATSQDEHCNPSFEPELDLLCDVMEWHRILERWSVPSTKAHFAGFRRVARSTDERTSIACVLPALPATYGWILFAGLSYQSSLILIGNANSLALDFCLRNSLSQPSIPQGVYQQLPFLPPAFYTESRLAFVTPRVLELSYTSHALAPFARDLGHQGPPFPWDEARRAHLRAELDAFYARAYGLTRTELRYILDPADVRGADYPTETFRVLKEKEIRQHGEYRTRRLVLAAWDRMEAGGEFAAMGM